MERENASAGVLTCLKGIGEVGKGMVSEEQGTVNAQRVNEEQGTVNAQRVNEEQGELRKAQDAAGNLSNQRKRDIAAMVNKTVHQFGGPELVFSMIADGKPITHVARDMNITTIDFYAWAEKTPERSRALAHARELAAHRLAEQGLEIVDNATPQTANLANIQARYRQWLAGKWNQQHYGESKNQVTVQLSINTAHLQANRVNAVNDHSNVIDVAPHNN
jgi:hypothetical protein